MPRNTESQNQNRGRGKSKKDRCSIQCAVWCLSHDWEGARERWKDWARERAALTQLMFPWADSVIPAEFIQSAMNETKPNCSEKRGDVAAIQKSEDIQIKSYFNGKAKLRQTEKGKFSRTHIVRLCRKEFIQMYINFSEKKRIITVETLKHISNTPKTQATFSLLHVKQLQGLVAELREGLHAALTELCELRQRDHGLEDKLQAHQTDVDDKIMGLKNSLNTFKVLKMLQLEHTHTRAHTQNLFSVRWAVT